MKKTLFILVLLFTFLSCKAQIAPLYKADPDLPEGTYYKDLNNDLDKFEGTWLWQDGNTFLTFVIEKKEQVQSPSRNEFNDMLIGEYKYVENGVEIVDFLDRLDDPTIIGFSHYLSGVRIMHKNHPPLRCEDCTNDERRVKLFFHDPQTPRIPNQVILRHIIVDGQEQLQAKIMGNGPTVFPEGSEQSQRVPYGEYTFIKQ